jgi:hypothetical protein
VLVWSAFIKLLHYSLAPTRQQGRNNTDSLPQKYG